MSLIDRIFTFFDTKESNGKSSLPSNQKHDTLKVAACAVFLEIAHSDSDFSREEEDVIRDIMRERFKLEDDQFTEILSLAEELRENAIDLWQFTNRINDHLNRTQRIEIMEFIWRIVFADGRLDGHEDHIAHRFAKLLRLQHRDMIDAKVRARQNQSN